MIKDAIEDAASLERTESSIDLYLDGWRCLEERKGGVMNKVECMPRTATLRIELYVECPHCENVFDLLTDTSLNDDGYLIKQAISDDRWAIPAEDRIECEPECPQCETVFNVKGLEW